MVDPDERLRARVRRGHVSADPGATSTASLWMRPRRYLWRGAVEPALFDVVVEPESAERIVLNGTLQQKQLIPRGVGWMLGLVATLALAMVLFQPDPKLIAEAAESKSAAAKAGVPGPVGGPGDDNLLIGDNGTWTGSAITGGNDYVQGGDGDDDLFGDNQAQIGGVTSGGGFDFCVGGAGTDTADANCDAVSGVP